MKRPVLIVILLIGTLLRFTNLNWDSYLAFHPDERNIAWAVTRIHFFDQMNPQFFAYGGLPIYLYRAIGELMVRVTRDTNWLFDWGHIAVLGRYVSATLSSISILLIYLVATSYFSKVTGLLSAFLLALSPWAIREAHFATTETMLVFFPLVLLLLAHKFFSKPSVKLALAQGIVLGLAVGAKTTSVLFALIPLVAYTRKYRLLLTLFIVAACIFFLFSPYTILDWQHFKESMDYESGVALGRFPVPYTLQFLKTIPYVYQFQTMLWQAGPIAVVGLAGLVFLAFAALKRKKRTFVIFLIFPLVYLLWQGSWFAKFARYNVPLLPFLTISAAWLIVSILPFVSRIGRIGLLVGLVGFHLWWGLANWSIYLRPQTRIEASKWMFKHIPPDATIYTEHWNDGLPVYLSGGPVIAYKRELLNVYDADTDQKKSTIAKQLENGDFIILSTRRIWGTMPTLADRYPFTSELYRKLLNGESNYKEVATFASYPSLFGITINDDAAEESIQVFDHPTVRIFQKSKKNAL
ncbi:glycosyltransferase family 39 protein [Candidatus Gottesmanbacteria bacterium]|nr:glycosyltransferase family 39 protein [Candidatus Gottesmanbacteria bacterium]